MHEGYVLQKAVVRSPISGERITDYLHSVLESKGVNVRPAYALSKKVGKDGTVLKVGEAAGIEHTRDSYKFIKKRDEKNDLPFFKEPIGR